MGIRYRGVGRAYNVSPLPLDMRYAVCGLRCASWVSGIAAGLGYAICDMRYAICESLLLIIWAPSEAKPKCYSITLHELCSCMT